MFSAFILLGLAATLGQILFLRELIVLFSGNEITLGIALASWLVGTGLGSMLVKWLRKIELSYFLLSFSLLSLILPISIILIRLTKPILGLGEIPSIPAILTLTFPLILPYALLTGGLFTLGCECLSRFLIETKKVITKVYLGEAIGAGLGGFVFYFVLCPRFQSLQIALYLSFLIAVYCNFQGNWGKQRTLKTINILIMIILLVAALNWKLLEKKSRRWQWRPYKVLAAQDTIYGQLTFLKNPNQIILYESGLYAFTYPDLPTVEHSVHLALLEHPRPQSVLLIGGGISGSLNEILKHPSVKNVVYVELDPTLIKLGSNYLPKEVSNVLKDKRIKLVYQDGRLFIKKTKTKYDVIILCLSDPLTAQLNRFYTQEFFEEIKAILNPKGLFCFGVSSTPDIIGMALGEFLRSIYFTIKSVFPEVVAFPGDTAYFLASLTKNTLSNNIDILIKRLNQRKIKVKYVQDYYLRADLSPFKVAYFRSILEKKNQQDLNTDLKPRCYFYSLVLWSTTYFPALRGMILKLRFLKVYHYLMAIGILGMLLFFLGWRFNTLPLLNAVGITGFTEISLEVVVLISFQVFYGYVYHELAVLITAFMLGLAMGSLIFHKYTLQPFIRWLFFLQAGLSLLCLLWLGITYGLHKYKPLLHYPYLFNLLFPLFLGCTGLLGGIQFLTASETYRSLGKNIKETAATLYSTDLLGSALGALLTSLVFLPLLGIPATLILLAGLNLMALILLFFY